MPRTASRTGLPTTEGASVPFGAPPENSLAASAELEMMRRDSEPDSAAAHDLELGSSSITVEPSNAGSGGGKASEQNGALMAVVVVVVAERAVAAAGGRGRGGGGGGGGGGGDQLKSCDRRNSGRRSSVRQHSSVISA